MTNVKFTNLTLRFFIYDAKCPVYKFMTLLKYDLFSQIDIFGRNPNRLRSNP